LGNDLGGRAEARCIMAEVAHEAEAAPEGTPIEPALTDGIEDHALMTSEPQTEPEPEEIATEEATVEASAPESAAEKT
ncbi:hypothetical protein ACC680_37280, partial [Rhizobium ruizarguesonis]